MIKNAKFYKTGHAFFGEKVAQEGFQGDVPTMPNAITILVIKPGSKWEDVKKSIETTLRDVELRIKLETDKAQEEEQATTPQKE